MTRQQANIKLLEILRSYLLTYPDIRFSQALFNLSMVSHVQGGTSNELPVWTDEYNLEPVELLKRVIQQIERNNQ